MPRQYNPEASLPLIVMLHGAGGTAEQSMSILQAYADTNGFILLAPESRRQTWDIILGRYGHDVVFINEALAQTFASCRIDKQKIAIAGFSDGSSYALSLGIINGDLFTDVLAFSPGFLAATSGTGSPRIFVSHGNDDQILPIDKCSRRIVRQLRSQNYNVTYREFDGPHTVPEFIIQEAISSFLNSD